MSTAHDDQLDRGTVLDVISQIRENRLDPRTLNKEERQTCVEVMMGEGVSAPSMAQVLKVSDKTIRRDIKDIRLKNSLTPDQNFSDQCAGEILWQIRVSRDHLMRLARSKDGSIGEKAQSEMYAVQVYLNGVAKLQSLGYLPEKPLTLVGDVVHHNDSIESDLKEWLKQIGPIASQSPSALGKQLNELKAEVAQIIDNSKGVGHEDTINTESPITETERPESGSQEDHHVEPPVGDGV